MSQNPGRAGAARYGHHRCASDGLALARDRLKLRCCDTGLTSCYLDTRKVA